MEIPFNNLRSKIRLGEHQISNEGPDCAEKYDWSSQKMVPDPNTCNAGVQDFEIEKIVHHPWYNYPHMYKNDIAIIKLKKKVLENSKYFRSNLSHIHI